MRIRSIWQGGTIFWRIFAASDNVLAIGLRDGLLSPGQDVEIHGPADLKVEIKRDGLFGKILVPAAEIYSNNDRLLLNGDGHLVRVPPTTLSSSWSGPIYWRMVLPAGTINLVGYAEGAVTAGQEGGINSGKLPQ